MTDRPTPPQLEPEISTVVGNEDATIHIRETSDETSLTFTYDVRVRQDDDE